MSAPIIPWVYGSGLSRDSNRHCLDRAKNVGYLPGSQRLISQSLISGWLVLRSS
jgi:hypothetical protein